MIEHLDDLLDPLIRTQLVAPHGDPDGVPEESTRQPSDTLWPCRGNYPVAKSAVLVKERW